MARRHGPYRSRIRKGVYYFPTYEAARAYAQNRGYPTDRIIPYTIGWAIQLRVSGPYVGPDTLSVNPERVLWWILSTKTTRTIFKGTISEAVASVERSKYVGTPAALYGPYKSSRQAMQAARG